MQKTCILNAVTDREKKLNIYILKKRVRIESCNINFLREQECMRKEDNIVTCYALTFWTVSFPRPPERKKKTYGTLKETLASFVQNKAPT